MKIISIVSSHRKDGNTTRLARLIEEQILSTVSKLDMPLEIERISLGDYDVQLCRGCRLCFDKGEEMCPLKDEILTIRDKIFEADGMIIASPVYVEDINGTMKNWIDRMAFNCHRPAFAGKAAVVVTTSGSGSSTHAIKTVSNALRTWGIYIAGQGRFRTGDLMKADEIKNIYHNKIKRIADELLISIKNNVTIKPSFYSIVVFKVQQNYWQKAVKYYDTIDFAYWKSKGWLEPQCEFYTAHRANPIKIKVARFIGGIVAVFFK